MSWIERVIQPFVRSKVERVSAVLQHDGGSQLIEKREVTGRGWELLKLLTGGFNKSGVTATQTSVLGLPAAFSCIRQISETVAMLPVHLHEKMNSSDRRYVNDHPSLPLLNKRANAITNSFDLRRDLVAYALIFPSAYVWIERDKLTAQPIALWLKEPTKVAEYMSTDERVRHYRVQGVEGPVMESDLIRLTNCFGKSVVHLLNEAFGTTIATQSFAAQYFASNGNVVRYATTPIGTKDKTQRQNLESDLSERFGPGSTDIPLLEYGIEVKELTGLNLSNAQALETRKWQAEDVCRIFNMPPSKIGLETNARYNSVEMTEMEFLRRTILPWITVIEQEFNSKLLTEQQKASYYFQHKTAALIKADIKTRLESYDKMSRLGWTINEIRELEDYDPITGGDVAFIQVNQIPLDKAQAYADKLISKGDMPGADNNLK